MTATLRLTEALIARPSVTPRDEGCQTLIAERLTAIGFHCESMDSGPPDGRVSNLWARLGQGDQPTLIFAGHTDVVPTGPLAAWASDPFVPSHRDGLLFGRGASDMKASLAAMVVACEEFVASEPQPMIDIAFLLTSDEEGPATDGTVIVCEALRQRGERMDWCIVGEPTSVERTGDMIKNGRRGTLSGKLTVKGIQGHIAYPHLAKNPIHLAAPALAALTAEVWDAGTGAGNVIPGMVVVDFNFRFSTESTPEGLQQRVAAILATHGLQPDAGYDLAWTLGGRPFLTTPGTLVDAVRDAVRVETGIETQLSTTIHKIDECVAVADIEPLKNIYRRVLDNLAAQASASHPTT